MTQDELIKYLKNNLVVKVERDSGINPVFQYVEFYTLFTITLAGEEITTFKLYDKEDA